MSGSAVQFTIPCLDTLHEQVSRIISESVRNNVDSILRQIALDYSLDHKELREKFGGSNISISKSTENIQPPAATSVTKQRRPRRVLPDDERCIALTNDGSRCTRRRKTGKNMCQTHINSHKSTIDDVQPNDEAELIQVDGETYIHHKGVLYECPDDVNGDMDLSSLKVLGKYVDGVVSLANSNNVIQE